MKYFLLNFLIFSCQVVSSQVTSPRAIIDTEIDSSHRLRTYKKSIPEKYSLAFYKAILHYPELDSTCIVVKEAKIKASLNARPTPLSLVFRKRENRKYVIRVNIKKVDSVVLFSDASFNAQVGVFGHELGHLVDYNQRSFGGVLKRLFSYSNIEGKERYEKEIDSITIQAGLGEELYAWSYFVLQESNGTEKYKTYKRQVYLEPEEIKALLNDKQ